MTRSALAFATAAAAALSLSACAAPKPPVAHVDHVNVSKHFVVVVQEPDPYVREEERAASLVTRPVAGGPLGYSSENEIAFGMRDPRYLVSVAWHGKCLDVTVARHGLAPFDDFVAGGCIVPEGPMTPLAKVTGASGAPIEIVLWVFDQA